MTMTVLDALDRYGEIQDGTWSKEANWCVIVQVPPNVAAKLINSATGKPTEHIYCNKDMAPSLLKALENVESRGLLEQLHTFDGCKCIRWIRGQPGAESAHSFAAAIDINAETNQLGTSGDMSDELAACFTDEGFTWGKNFSRKDPMHMSWLGW